MLAPFCYLTVEIDSDEDLLSGVLQAGPPLVLAAGPCRNTGAVSASLGGALCLQNSRDGVGVSHSDPSFRPLL